MGLGFGGARANRRPADQVLQILRGDRVEGFSRRRQAHFGQITQQGATDVQAVLNLERVIQVRVVDQTFPADGGARLFEIHAHDQKQAIRDFSRQHLEALGIFVGRLDVMDRARADDHEQAMILAVEDVADDFAAMGHGLKRRVGQRDFALELLRGNQGFVGGNVKVVDG